MRGAAGWTQTTVGEVLERVADPVVVDPSKTYQEIGIRSHGKGLFDKEPVPGVVLGEKRVFWIRPDCFIVNIVFAWERAVGRTTVEDVGKIASHRFPMYRPKSGLVDVDYLLHFFKTEQGRELLALASPGGAGRNKTLGQKEFLKLPLCLPPFREQRRIAEILSSIDETIETTQAVIEQSSKVKQGVLSRLLTRGFGHRRFKQTEIGEIPEAWKVVTLSEVVLSLDAGVSVNSESRTKKDDELGVLKTSSVSTGVFCPDEHKVVLPDELGRVKTPVQADRIIVSRMNTPNLVGASVYVDQDYPDLFLPDRLWQLDVKDRSQINVRWLAQLLAWGNTRERISGLASGTSSSMKNIPKSRLLEMQIPLPPIREQQQQALIISEFEGEDARAVQEMHKLQAVKSALLSDLLTGRKRVTADALSPAL